MKISLAFWDSSAIVPVCFRQPSTRELRGLARECRRIVTWWGTAVEARSAFDQLFRRGSMSEKDLAHAMVRLNFLRRSWQEVGPIDQVREIAEELPQRYGLRAADAFQLAAALVWCKELPKNRVFVCADKHLGAAAHEAGFTVLG